MEHSTDSSCIRARSIASNGNLAHCDARLCSNVRVSVECFEQSVLSAVLRLPEPDAMYRPVHREQLVAPRDDLGRDSTCVLVGRRGIEIRERRGANEFVKLIGEPLDSIDTLWERVGSVIHGGYG